MNHLALPQAELFKLVILVASIVVAVFFSTVLVAFIFMPTQLFWSMHTQDIRFLVPMALATVCSATVLGLYCRTNWFRFKK